MTVPPKPGCLIGHQDASHHTAPHQAKGAQELCDGANIFLRHVKTLFTHQMCFGAGTQERYDLKIPERQTDQGKIATAYGDHWGRAALFQEALLLVTGNI